MLNTIERIEREYPDVDSAEVNYWFGIAWRNFTAWFIRGEERRGYLEKAVAYLEKAYEIEKRSSGNRWKHYASELGRLLVGEKVVRDLGKGIAILEEIYLKETDYEPALYYYFDGLYKTGEFEKAAEIALEISNRAAKSEEWKNSFPSGLKHLAAKAYRALVRKYKKEGSTNKALEISERLMENPAATENDKRNHEKLKKILEKKNGTLI